MLIVSGIQPTGNLHLGNYLGAIRNWAAMQEIARKHPFFWNPGYSGHLRPVADPDFKE